MNHPLLQTLALALALSAAAADEWPQFRGPVGQGVSEAKDLPIHWSETDNVVWKTALPGSGYSSPVVSGNRIWLTTALDKGHSRHVLCLAFDTGKILRDIELFTCETPEPCHTLNSYATPTPVLEDDRVYVTFGSPGTACLDAETGQTLWARRDIIVDYRDVGAASSPILYKDKLILTCDGQTGDKQFVTALDKRTGRTLWRTERIFPSNTVPEYVHSSCVPLVIPVGGHDQLVSPAGHGVHAYDPENGHELWQAWYDGWSVVPRPVFAEGRVYICNGTVKPLLLCLRPEGLSGDITERGCVWKTKKNVPGMPSPLLIGERLYTLTATSLSCLNAATGQELWSGSLPGQHMASPVAADGHIFAFSRGKTSTVIEQGDTFRILATNRLDEGCMASPAIAGRSLIVRTTRFLYRLENRP